MAVWPFPRGLILFFTFLCLLSIMTMLKCFNDCSQKYEATNLRALKNHQKHCEAAHRQHTQSMQTRKMDLAKDSIRWTALYVHHCHTNAAEV